LGNNMLDIQLQATAVLHAATLASGDFNTAILAYGTLKKRLH